jgi:hypothetical protein
MAYQGIRNSTPFAAAPLLLIDAHGRDVLVVLVKASYAIAPEGLLHVAPVQVPLCLEGEHYGDPATTSLKTAPEGGFTKTATDIVLIGHAHAPYGRPVAHLDVHLRVGPVHHTVRVIGDRVWKKHAGWFSTRWKMSAPQPFMTMPLVYERAFGGVDNTPDDEPLRECDARNPVGTGWVAAHGKKTEQALPNLEDPSHLIRAITDRPPPAGFGAIAAHWQPRSGYAGTHDDAWEKTRMPLLPADFDDRFFNVASPALIASGFLAGNEAVEIVHAVPEGRLAFNLPGDVPEFQLTMDGEMPQPLAARLDRVTIDTDARTVQMLWRASANVHQRLYDIHAVDVAVPTLAHGAARAA